MRWIFTTSTFADFTPPVRAVSLACTGRTLSAVSDATVTNAGFNWYYVYHPESFSLKAAFDQTEFQRESGGSWLIIPYYNHLECLSAPASFRGKAMTASAAWPNLHRAVSIRWALHSVTDILTSTGAFSRQRSDQRGRGQLQRLNRAEGTSVQPGLALKINVNSAAGWNFKEYVGGLQFLFDSLSCNVRERRSPPIFCRANYFSARVFELWSCQPASVSGRYNVVMKRKGFSQFSPDRMRSPLGVSVHADEGHL